MAPGSGNAGCKSTTLSPESLGLNGLGFCVGCRIKPQSPARSVFLCDFCDFRNPVARSPCLTNKSNAC